jgi:hypothetical protein
VVIFCISTWTLLWPLHALALIELPWWLRGSRGLPTGIRSSLDCGHSARVSAIYLGSSQHQDGSWSAICLVRLHPQKTACPNEGGLATTASVITGLSLEYGLCLH